MFEGMMVKIRPNLMKILKPQVAKAQQTQQNVKHKKRDFMKDIKLRTMITSSSEPGIKKKTRFRPRGRCR